MTAILNLMKVNLSRMQKRRDLIKILGLGTVGAAMLPVSCTSSKEKDPLLNPILRIAHLTDMHIEPDSPAEEGVKKCIEHILNKEQRIDYFVNGGDIIMDALRKNEEETAKQWQVWQRIKAYFPELKFIHCIGNHDVWGLSNTDEEAYPGKSWAMQELGLESPYYTFESKGWHFIVLDSTHRKDDGSWYTAKLDSTQRQWLEMKLKEIPADQNILIISHIPIIGATPFLDGDNAKTGDWIVPGAWMHTDAKSLIQLFYQHKNVKLCISGHIHIVESLLLYDVHYHCSGAVSGNWWNDEPYELTNKGYAILELFEDGYHTYRYKLYYV